MGHQMGESESRSCARVFELYIVDEIKKGVFIFLRLFIGDRDMPLKKLKLSYKFIRRHMWTGWSKDMVTSTGPYSCIF
jgi:hypothetical protein